MQPIGSEYFQHDGRGPTLRRAHWDSSGTVLRAIDYRNPTTPADAPSRHVVVVRPQVVTITPEEVIDYNADQLGDALASLRPAAAFELGRSVWLQSFSPRHLRDCRHYKLMFYDQLIDVIAEGIEFRVGTFEVVESDVARLLAVLEKAGRGEPTHPDWPGTISTHYTDPAIDYVRSQAALTAHRLEQQDISPSQAAEYFRALARRLRAHGN